MQNYREKATKIKVGIERMWMRKTESRKNKILDDVHWAAEAILELSDDVDKLRGIITRLRK